MYIKEITIDGFKSYGQKTTISGFDRYFNAITGLNGSGKSNILDSICFLLGIQNMSLVRVNNLRELIYKNGQTGITKATVTITFDNTDRQQSPTGYENDKEIVIRKEINTHNQTKYYINGDKKLANQIVDFFHSVQLNVNNPHFLIMQGRVMKVINMKPREVFGMIEEATNVSMYENKKRDAQNSIEKKNIDLKHIDTLLKETIMPRFHALEKDHKELLEYTKLKTELEHKENTYTAWRFIHLSKICDESDAEVGAERNKITQVQQQDVQITQQIEQLGQQILELEHAKDRSDDGGSSLDALEEDLKKVQLVETQFVSQLNIKKDNRKEEEKKLKALQKSMTNEQKEHQKKQQELTKLRESYDGLKATYERNQQLLEQAQKNFEAISTGRTCENGEMAGTLVDQLKQTETELNKQKTEQRRLEDVIKHIKTDLARKETELRNARKKYDKNDETIEQVEVRLQQAKAALDNLTFDPEQQNQHKQQREQTLGHLRQSNESLKRLESQNPSLSFKYKPVPSIQPEQVHGVVANLFRVKDPKFELALEKAAGGRLLNVVVENDATAKEILKQPLERRITFLPMNQLNPTGLDERKLKIAQRLVGEDNVFAAIKLIDYDAHLNKAMQSAFGNTLICTDMDIAKKVAYHNDVKARTVTLDGEVFDPSGTITGGSQSRGSSILAAAAQIQDLKIEIEKLRSELEAIDHQLHSLESASKNYAQLKAQYDKAGHSLELVRIKYKVETDLLDQISKLTESQTANEAAIAQSREQVPILEQKMNDLQYKINNSKAAHAKELKDAKDKLAAAKKAVTNTTSYEELDSKVNSLQFEIDELAANIAKYEEQCVAIEAEIVKFDEAIEKDGEKVQDAKKAVKEVQDKIDKRKEELKRKCKEISKLQSDRDKLSKKLENNKIEVKKLEHGIEQMEKRAKDAAATIRQLLKEYPWIEKERANFDKPGFYDFRNFNADSEKSRIETMKNKFNQLKRTVNQKANILLQDTENEINDLRKKRTILETDKERLLEYIAQVDREKHQTLQQAYDKINEDFGKIFSTLLPGTKAKLEQLDGRPIHEGLRIRIGFGDIWKESLSELSGGQRSLVALSLIFALLLYKPAPIYILDEVDAALDNSHTQNIGIMIKNYFSRSQFIIVSLKDDMFNNASVLFRTKFVNGTSAVSRASKNEL